MPKFTTKTTKSYMKLPKMAKLRLHPMLGKVWQVLPETGGSHLAILAYPGGLAPVVSVLELGGLGLVGRLNVIPGRAQMREFQSGILVFQEYPDPGLPKAAGILAFHIPSMEKAWSLAGARVIGVSAGVIHAETADGQGIRLELQSGACFPVEQDEKAGMEAWEQARVACLHWPSQYENWPLGCAEPAAWKQLGPVWHFEHSNGRHAIAYHQQGENGLELWLAFAAGNEAIDCHCLETGMAGMNPEPFFLVGDIVVAVSHTDHLLLADLTT